MLVQFCLAHWIRDVKYLCEFPDPSVQRYGRGLLAGLQALFGTLHRKDEVSAAALEARLDKVYAQIWKAALPRSRGPCHRLIWDMAERFAKHGDAYFQFITHPDIDPTNDVVEQAMRFVVIDRHVTQGTRSAREREIPSGSGRSWPPARCTDARRFNGSAQRSRPISRVDQLLHSFTIRPENSPTVPLLPACPFAAASTRSG